MTVKGPVRLGAKQKKAFMKTNDDKVSFAPELFINSRVRDLSFYQNPLEQ